MVLFGGDSLGGELFGDTWEWDGAHWTQVEDTGPSPRSGHALAYDSGRSRVVLFGGGVPAPRGDTWEWDGQGWTQIDDTGPEPRQGHAVAYDSSRSRTVLFGGEAAGPALRGDTWEWDGQGWTQVQDTGPSARKAHALAYDGSQQRMILYGGDLGGNAAADTWAWNGTTWTEVEDIGPGPVSDSAVAAGGAGMILFGGMAGSPAAVSGLTWEWDGAHWTLRQDIGPSPRWGHAAAFDTNRGRAVLFGGASVPPTDAAVADHVLGDTWEETDEGAGGQPPPPPQPGNVQLVSFTLTPDTINAMQGGVVMVTVGIDQPAPAPVTVQIGAQALIGATTITIMPGQSTGQTQLPFQGGLPPMGDIQLSAELNGAVLAATLHLT
jgi:hypothetical protein